MSETNSNILLTIAIPTFNRAEYLKENLKILVNQSSHINKVEIIVIDNASTDHTREVCQKYYNLRDFSYIRLDKNLGMSSSQYESLSRARGKYVCLIADDDFLRPNGLKLILQTISSNYDLYAFNYSSSTDLKAATTIGPIESNKFEYGYELLNFPSVGHMSGLVYRTNKILDEAENLLEIFPLKYFNYSRGIFGIAFAALAQKTRSSAYYQGEALFSAVEQKELDYNGLLFLCLQIFTTFSILRKLEIVGSEIFHFQKTLVQSRIIRSYIRWYPVISEKERMYVDYLLTPYFNDKFLYKLVFETLKIRVIRNVISFIFRIFL